MKHLTFSRAVRNTSVFLAGLWTVLLALVFMVGFYLFVLVLSEAAIIYFRIGR